MRFEWHPQKANANIKKHGIDFYEAMTVFDDPFALMREDTLLADTEPREIALGYSNQQRLLVVCFVERKTEIIRIISAVGWADQYFDLSSAQAGSPSIAEDGLPIVNPSYGTTDYPTTTVGEATK